MRALTRQAAVAEFFLSSPRTLETWVERGLLTPASRGMYWEDDVSRVEAATRRRPRLVRLIDLAQAPTIPG